MSNCVTQVAVLFCVSLVPLCLALPQSAHGAEVTGWIRSGDTPIVASKVTLYKTGDHGGHSVEVLGKAETGESGYFKISYRQRRGGTSFLYLIAEGGSASGAESGRNRGAKHGSDRHGDTSGPISFATVLGANDTLADVVLNELTTVATAYTLAQFIDGTEIKGNGPGPRNAADILRTNLVDIHTGKVADFLGLSPNGSDTSTLRTFNSLANVLAACVNDESQCAMLFQLATPPGGKAPRNTFEAAVNVAHYPGQNLTALFNMSQIDMTYEPALAADALTSGLINSWILALRYIGDGPNGQGFDGPGNVAFDKDGNAWINNNYAFAESSDATVCGSTRLLKLTPTGGNAPGAPFGGQPDDGSGSDAGGLYGAGFGIAVDPKGAVWVTNFGFQGAQCTNHATTLFVSVSKFNAQGQALSPDGDPASNVAGGYLGEGNIAAPQGVLSDREGNVWLANCVSDSVTRFEHGNPYKAKNVAGIGVEKPFDVAFDTGGHVWVTGNDSNNAVELDRRGVPVGEVKNLDRPMGIASDSLGNLWVANAGVMNPPCPALLPEDEIGDDGANNIRAAVTLIRQDGRRLRVATFGKEGGKRDGLRWPWGIAVDGNDNVWVANFAGQRLMQLCGVSDRRYCPPGVRTGDPIAPDAGYFFNGLARVTGVQIDPSGNVWEVNNWLINGFAVENPGGKQVVVFLGLAGPVKTPMLGTPRRP
jgi:hypothetical protein